MLFGDWGHAMIASIRGGMPMINKVLTIIAFTGFCLEQFFYSSIPSRLLGVNRIQKYIDDLLEISGLCNRFFIARSHDN